MEAEHQRITVCGVHAVGSRTVTSVMFGLLRDNPRAVMSFLNPQG
jgi:GTP cyclohydrolase I